MSMTAPPKTKARPIPLRPAEVLDALSTGCVTIRRPVKAPRATAVGSDGKPCGRMMFDLSRAWIDHGFPLDDNGDLMPVNRWSGSKGQSDYDPAPESAYRNQYLHVPAAHPLDGWEAEPRHDRVERIYCPMGEPGDELWVQEAWAEGVKRPIFKADFDVSDGFGSWVVDMTTGEMVPLRWRSPVQMPRSVSRLTLKISAVRVEKVGASFDWVVTCNRLTTSEGLNRS